MKKKFILIAKYFSKDFGGPKAIVQGLLDNYNVNNVDFLPLLYTESQTKLRYISNLVKVCIKEKNATINVHTFGYFLPFVVMLISKCNHKNNYYLTVHGLYSAESHYDEKNNKLYFMLEKVIMRHFDNIICVSEMLRKDIERKYRRNKNIMVIPNATDAQSSIVPKETNNRLNIIYLGGLRKCKGIENVLNLSLELKKRGIDFSTLLYGNDEWGKDNLNSFIEKHDLKGYIHYMGATKDKQMLYDKIASADIQLCLSNYDTFNTAIAESLVLGCPVIATQTCGASYLIEGESGIVVDVNNSNYIEKACDYVESFMKEPDKRLRVFAQRRKYISKLRWASIVERYISL